MVEICISSYPGLGHLVPLLQLGERLVSNEPSVRVRIFTQLGFQDEVKLESHVQPNASIEVRLLARTDLPTIENGMLYSLKDMDGTFSAAAIRYYEDLGSKPSVVINGQLVGWGEVVAEHFGVPLWVFHASPAFTIPLYIQEGATTPPPWRLTPPPSPDSMQCECSFHERPKPVRIPLLGAIEYDEMPQMPPSPLFEMFVRSFRGLTKASGILCNDVDELYNEAMLEFINSAVPVMNIGPLCLADSRLKAASSHLSKWLDQFPANSVVFVSLGSWCDLSAADVVELAMGLERCNRPVLWAYRGRSIQNEHFLQEDRQACCEVDERNLPLGWEPRVSHRVLVAPWVNQAAVLKHPSVGCFITHCGWNGLLESIAYRGLPVVAIPLAAEQVINSRLVTDVYHIGIRVWKSRVLERLDRDKIVDAINTVMNHGRFRINAHRLHRLASVDNNNKVQQFLKAIQKS
ncbi:UDP-glucosyltransferase [Gregarina niphandrodes]|uniref:UDP-glucosyltransferase n=1 Tax=Gregarina niphandrodes TaxID=110365 RepID=A0A023B7J5_GRENI|nr:UDP-glucosyltransferase [Gregarina niphandrodes]EZG67407.1 UDP-glucosyltransferase [Gregarina niphandrodes]|eukprot:XP_011130240.1 UDP-glucosyltransferase [Gregarina niphandrodes]